MEQARNPKLAGRDIPFELSEQEKTDACILVVEPDNADVETIRAALRGLGYGAVICVGKHSLALKQIYERRLSHMMFTTVKTDMRAADFLAQALKIDEKIVQIPYSHIGHAEQIFSLLKLGANGFLIKPYSTDNIEHAILIATKGRPIASSILHAKDRNKAFSAIVAGSLDKLSNAIRQEETKLLRRHDMAELRTELLEVVRLGSTFSTGGSQGFQRAIENMFIELSRGPATNLGRLRKRLQEVRAKKLELDGELQESAS